MLSNLDLGLNSLYNSLLCSSYLAILTYIACSVIDAYQAWIDNEDEELSPRYFLRFLSATILCAVTLLIGCYLPARFAG